MLFWAQRARGAGTSGTGTVLQADDDAACPPPTMLRSSSTPIRRYTDLELLMSSKCFNMSRMPSPMEFAQENKLRGEVGRLDVIHAVQLHAHGAQRRERWETTMSVRQHHLGT